VPRLRDSHGFSLIELLIVLVITTGAAAIVVPSTSTLFQHLRLSGDAHALSNSVSLVKMRSAAEFTRVRLYADLANRTYRIERYQKVPPAWVPEGGSGLLSSRVNMSTGGLATPPPNTQAAILQAPPCLNINLSAIANTACIVFNSRGVPIDTAGVAGTPTAADALYVTDGTAVYAVTVAATGLIRLWKSGPATAGWIRQ
jgi:prepilin-type N-terminal cleavage/methylation domain-containing protein